MKRVILCAVFALLLAAGAAAETDVFARQGQALELARVEQAAPKDGAVSEITEEISLDDGLRTIAARFGREFRAVFRRSLACIGVILAIAVLSAIVNHFCDAGSDKLPRYIGAAGALAVTAAASGSISSFVGMGAQAIDSMSSFSKALLPTLSAAVAASGSPLGATARYSATVLFSDIALTAIHALLIPLIYTYIAATTANAAIPGAAIGKIADFLHWVVSGSLKLIVTIFIAYLTVSGIAASTTDAVGAKTARAAISGAVPVVGGILSDAAETVLAGAKLMKNAVGVFGMLTILSICLTPFLSMAVQYLLYKLTAFLAGTVTEGPLAGLIDALGTAFGLMLGMTGSCALLLLISITSSVSAVLP